MMGSEAGSLTAVLGTIREQYMVNSDMSALESFVRNSTNDKEGAAAEWKEF